MRKCVSTTTMMMMMMMTMLQLRACRATLMSIVCVQSVSKLGSSLTRSVAMPAVHDVWSVLKIVEDVHARWVQQVRAHAERLSFHDWHRILGDIHTTAIGPRESTWQLSDIAPTLVMRSPSLQLRSIYLPLRSIERQSGESGFGLTRAASRSRSPHGSFIGNPF